MSNKIEVERNTLIRAMNIEDVEDRFKAIHELRGLLAAPVVERPPDAWATLQAGWKDEDRTVMTDPVEAEEYHRACYDLTPLFTAPPELAELQAQLESIGEDVGQLRSELEDAEQERAELQATIAQQAAEIKRLKGGQGEPRAYRWRIIGSKEWALSTSYPPVGDQFEIVPLYTSQPAPVAVVLSKDLRAQYETWADAMGYDISRNEHGDYAGIVEDSMWSGWQAKAEHWALPGRIDRGQSIELDAKAIGWNACLDRVKELNP